MKPSFLEILFARRSIRKFRATPVAEEKIRALIEAACAAPSAHNTQPWRFVVLRSEAARRNLAERMVDAWRRDAEANGKSADEIRVRNERSVERISQAPLAVLFCADRSSLPPDAGRRACGEELLLAQSVAAAVQNFLLAAQAEGLGTCWIGAPAFCPQVVRETLDLAETWEAQALILVGHSAETPERPSAKNLDEVALWR